MTFEAYVIQNCFIEYLVVLLGGHFVIFLSAEKEFLSAKMSLFVTESW